MSYPTNLLKKEEAAEGTLSFYFAKPADFQYKAGQSIDLTLIDPPETDAEGNTRAYSLSSAPHEDDLMITTRLRDTAFKRVLRELKEGTGLNIDGPFGSMTLHHDASKPALILAGGIGITPFYSIIKQATFERAPQQIFLFYSNRRPEDTAFLKELQALEKENPNFKFIPTMTKMEGTKADWAGETGYINKEMVSKYLPEAAQTIGYLAGPAEMVRAMRQVLHELGIDDDYIRTEEFSGY